MLTMISSRQIPTRPACSRSPSLNSVAAFDLPTPSAPQFSADTHPWGCWSHPSALSTTLYRQPVLCWFWAWLSCHISSASPSPSWPCWPCLILNDIADQFRCLDVGLCPGVELRSPSAVWIWWSAFDAGLRGSRSWTQLFYRCKIWSQRWSRS